MCISLAVLAVFLYVITKQPPTYCWQSGYKIDSAVPCTKILAGKRPDRTVLKSFIKSRFPKASMREGTKV